jgi:phospholipid/cholesterol/gamma-HCH transport system permease protein
MRSRGREPAALSALAHPPSLGTHRASGTLVVVLAGEWAIERSIPDFHQLMAEQSDQDGIRAVAFESGGLAAWDSSLLTFLIRGAGYCEAHGLEFEEAGLPTDVTRLLALARAVPEREPAAVEPSPSFPARVGERGLSASGQVVASITFGGEVARSIGRLAVGRGRLRWRDFWVVVQSNGSGALPIVTLIAFLIGVIIAFLGVVVLRRFGAGFYVSYLIGYGVLREMGALMTGIIMAGRTGAAFAAELGSMKITEEIDAYTTLGVSAVDHLVLPRVLGLFVMMPLLVLYADAVGIAGGLLVAVTMLDLSPTQFFGGLLTAVALPDALIGLFKGSIFGLIIGLAGCMKGLQTGSDAGAVGRSATSAVVLGITLIIVANAVIDWLAALLQI